MLVVTVMSESVVPAVVEETAAEVMIADVAVPPLVAWGEPKPEASWAEPKPTAEPDCEPDPDIWFPDAEPTPTPPNTNEPSISTPGCPLPVFGPRLLEVGNTLRAARGATVVIPSVLVVDTEALAVFTFAAARETTDESQIPELAPTYDTVLPALLVLR
jgi:hypothetical protein